MIAVLSDSHVPRRADTIPEKFMERAEKADLTVHAGDLVAEEVLVRLEETGDVKAVKGNCDLLDLPNSETFTREGINVGVYHGTGINPRGHTPTLVSVAEKMDVRVLITGHTHQQEAYISDGRIILNPGSCTGVGGGSSRSGTPGMMEIRSFDPLVVEELELQESGLKSSRSSFEV